MAPRRTVTIDGNEAVTSIAHRVSDLMVIYPITPSSTMGELADDWSAHGRRNLWGQVPQVVEMQSEGGAAGAIHGALQAGALATTFTASQGLLLMIPNLYKIAGELTPFCIHVAARTLATHALSIFGDHSDVMACRQTGLAMLCSSSVQEAHDQALIAHAATLRARVPFMHFFDGFRTSHEISKVEELADDDLLAMLDADAIAAHRARALTPDRPVLRGAAQNPDTFFQAREACNPAHAAVPAIVQAEMDRFATLTGRRYSLVEYSGDPSAQRVIVVMGSGAQTAQETAAVLAARGERVGVLTVRLFRPFPIDAFAAALPQTVRHIAVLDRTKEPGSVGEPLYLDTLAALAETADRRPSAPRVIGGRYGLSSKEFTPAMVKAVFDELAAPKPRRHFTVGIVDDVTRLSLPVDEAFSLESPDTVRAVFYGLGADGTVGANKNSIKIIGEETPGFAQAYFVYDSKKSGAMTISHLRFGPRPIRAPYLIQSAGFVAVHQFKFIGEFDVLALAGPGATLLLNCVLPAEKVWDALPLEAQEQIVAKRLRVYTIDAGAVATDAGLGGRINTVMQTCFFAISGVLPREQAIAKIKQSIEKSYGKRGEEVIARNFAAVDATLARLATVPVPDAPTATRRRVTAIDSRAPDFVRRVTAVMMAHEGDRLPVSAFPVDGTWPLGTARWEKRAIAPEVPQWEPELCIQCNKCAFVCPHAAIRAAAYEPAQLERAPAGFKSADYKAPDLRGMKYTIQVAPDDCTGCNLCVAVCPAKDKTNPRRKAINMTPAAVAAPAERPAWDFFTTIPPVEPGKLVRLDAKSSQFRLPLFEFSGACAGCGETPYLKLLTQLFGDRIVIANATGCSSIYGGNLPTTPYTTNAQGRGPAWSNSLFEDNAEFGLGIRLGVDGVERIARHLLEQAAPRLGEKLAGETLGAAQLSDADLDAQRARVAAIRKRIAELRDPSLTQLDQLADYLVAKSVWIIGGDGWAYDIGFGGLDHVLSMRRKVNILVLDTEVYSNTGGQASKATPLGAAAKFATAGKDVHKKDLGLIAMSYDHVYVASVAFGAKENQTVQAFAEAQSYPGPSLIIAYSPCIAHGYDLRFNVEQQKLAVSSGVWPLYRFDPRLAEKGQPPLQLDSPPTTASAREYMRNETRFRMVEKIDPARFKELSDAAVEFSAQRVALYQQLAQIRFPSPGAPAHAPQPAPEPTP